MDEADSCFLSPRDVFTMSREHSKTSRLAWSREALGSRGWRPVPRDLAQPPGAARLLLWTVTETAELLLMSTL